MIAAHFSASGPPLSEDELQRIDAWWRITEHGEDMPKIRNWRWK
jgi:phosphoketolase